MFDRKIVFLWIITFFIIFISFFTNNQKIHKKNIDYPPMFILPYEGNLWIVSENGKIIDVVDDYNVIVTLPVFVIPEDYVDFFSGTINEKFLKKIPIKVPNFIFEINFVENYMVLNNNSKVFFNEYFDFQMYFEKLKIVYKYIEPNKIYFFSNDKLVKVR
ncbi:hypothetical protein SU69_06450 [Thermosipho melanesiensis]|uniref:Uncharacterized protein n=3 Tax=Thermosipho melanesiensis TaxID=46541 RepID=A6LMH1_THEM4|nr:hypothetical protein Tmel_1273 [Thermosipho melanesiensis BI429]APT74213.1 hypothetical protein BW47_06770 [Thermosipho melanesiensis]OOC36159.1 hypothetical protein SU68_06520 [Thermosipho melanesiensis]OOC36976.1 hypothetical protein SU69_06450 [Thermosipho melanesiensis]OOC37728.1 hypothetical protein SU70_06460 [Thermosipho melanesiensis]